MTDIKKMNLESEDLVADRIAQMKRLFPEIATEGSGSIDFDRLRLILGDSINNDHERYAFTWPGKADAIHQSQTVSTATLRPCIGKSRSRTGKDGSFDSDNIYIEGDNLEALKLLQRGYHGKIKMIYIDPPYNTGHDFVYTDSFNDTIENYKQQANLTNQSNPDTSGRFHSKWCSMMYPRLKLARELLSEDGVFIVSISDNECANLKSLLDEIFGERNYCGDILWNSTKSVTNTALLSVSHTYNYVYFKNIDFFVEHRSEFRLHDDGQGFSNPDNDPRGPWKADPFQVGGWRPNQQYAITNPETGDVYKPNPGCSWKNDYQHFLELQKEGCIVFGSTGKGGPQRKRFLSQAVDRGKVAKTWWDDVETTTNGTQLVKKLFNGLPVFDNPKPVGLIKKFIELASSPDCIILDFFAGSSTTAQAVLEANAEDSGKRRFIMVQLPEICGKGTIAASAGYSNICQLSEERIRRAGNQIRERNEEQSKQLEFSESPKQTPDIGFRVFKLDNSGIVHPQAGQLILDIVKPDRSNLDIVFEMMLKWGLELTMPVEKSEAAGYPIWSVASDELICCMSEGLTIQALEAVAKKKPRRVLILDSILNDTLKLNAVLIFKHASERIGTEIELRTV